MKKTGSVRSGMKLWGLALLCLWLTGLLAACGENPTATPTATPAATPTPTPIPPTPTPVKPLTPAEIAKTSADKLNTLNSLHFIVDIKAGQVEIYQGITFKKADGDFSKPDKFRAKLRVTVAIAQVDAETVGLEGQQYLLLTNLSKSWVTLPPNVGFRADVLFDPQKGVGAVVTKIQNIEMVGTEQIDGTDVYHLKGVVKGADIAPLTAGTLGKNDVNFDVWTGKSDFLVRRVTFKEISTAANASDWQLDFSKFNEPVTINRPPGVAAPTGTTPPTTTGPTTPSPTA